MVSEHFGSLKGSYIEKRSDDATKTNFVMLLWDWSAYSAKKDEACRLTCGKSACPFKLVRRYKQGYAPMTPNKSF